MQRIQTLQNQLIKVLAHKHYRYPTNVLHNEFNFLKVKDIANQEILTFVHNYFANKLPPVFDNYFVTYATCHDRNTRSGSTQIKPPRFNTKIADLSIKYMGAKIWNELSNDLKSISNSKMFRRQYKNLILPYVTNSNA